MIKAFAPRDFYSGSCVPPPLRLLPRPSPTNLRRPLPRRQPPPAKAQSQRHRRLENEADPKVPRTGLERPRRSDRAHKPVGFGNRDGCSSEDRFYRQTFSSIVGDECFIVLDSATTKSMPLQAVAKDKARSTTPLRKSSASIAEIIYNVELSLAKFRDYPRY